MNTTFRTSRLCLLALSILLPAGCGTESAGLDARTEAAARLGIDSTKIAAAEALLDSLMVAKGLPGLAAAVSVRGEIVWAKGFGWADLEKHIPVTTATQFRVGSVSKLLTATAAARLYQEGRLDLDAPVQRYVPAFPPSDPPITPRLLLGHLSGIRHYGDDYMNDRPYGDVRESLGKFSGDSLRSVPGSEYFYSSFGYNLLGAVLQSASGEEFRQFIRRSVLDPLRMERTVAEVPGVSDPNRAVPYDAEDPGGHVPSDFIDLSDRWPSGGYLSTAEDLARFGGGLLTTNLLEPEVRALAFATQRTTAGEPTGVAWGWRVDADAAGRRILHHGGSSLGGRAFLLLYPEEQVVVSMVSNLSFADFAQEEALALARAFTGGTGP